MKKEMHDLSYEVDFYSCFFFYSLLFLSPLSIKLFLDKQQNSFFWS